MCTERVKRHVQRASDVRNNPVGVTDEMMPLEIMPVGVTAERRTQMYGGLSGNGLPGLAAQPRSHGKSGNGASVLRKPFSNKGQRLQRAGPKKIAE